MRVSNGLPRSVVKQGAEEELSQCSRGVTVLCSQPVKRIFIALLHAISTQARAQCVKKLFLFHKGPLTRPF